MAELVLKWRECDSDSVKLLGIGKPTSTCIILCVIMSCLLQRDLNQKFESLGDCPPSFNVCAN